MWAMYKRTRSYLLLLLVVITGLASQVNNPTLDRKERRLLVNQLKDSKTAVLESVKGLSNNQLAFKPAPDKWSIQECLAHIALSEQGLWSMAEDALKKPANPEKRAEIKIKDADILNTMKDRSKKATAPEGFQPDKATWENTTETLAAFKTNHQRMIQIAKSTTQDLRSHTIQSAMGLIDVYQFMLIVPSHTARHVQQIQEIKKHPSFPKQ